MGHCNNALHGIYQICLKKTQLFAYLAYRATYHVPLLSLSSKTM